MDADLLRALRTPEDVNDFIESHHAAARADFWEFRRWMRPDLIEGWWLEDAARELQRFWESYLRGERPKLILMAPPQHGKTWTMTDFTAWVAGKNPDLKQIFVSYSDSLGTKVNADLQLLMTSPRWPFRKTRIIEVGDDSEGPFKRTSKNLQFVGNKGSFINTTVRGQITGFGLDFGYIDDPLKGREEANSKTWRDKTWDWVADNFYSRFSERAAMIMTLTRWHVDDPAGRWMERFPDTTVLRYSAIADESDWTVDVGHRGPGEPLFPEYKSAEFLEQRRKLYTRASWESLYQQRPVIVGGGSFPVAKIKVISAVPRAEVRRSVRYWDKAGTEGGGAYTAGVLMHEMADETFVVEDVRHGQWQAREREDRIAQAANTDKRLYPRLKIYVEQEPGSSGKESAQNTISRLRGHRVFADRVTGDKESRAEPFAAQVQGGNVSVLAAEWNRTYFDELEQFPSGKYKDQVDASSGAFNKLTISDSRYDSSMMWTLYDRNENGEWCTADGKPVQ